MTAMSALRILCVDDNKDILRAMSLHFARVKDFEVVGSLSSAAGLEAAVRNKHPDIIVLDLDMPGKSPMQALRDVNASGAATRAIVFSGHVRAKLVSEAIDAGAWGYVSKSDGEDALVAAIRSVMAGEIGLSPEVRSAMAGR